MTHAADAGVQQPKPVMTGALERASVEAIPGWKSEAAIDEAAAKKLAQVPAGASVTIVFGTWCGDSRREVPRFWKALDVVTGTGAAVPFSVKLVGVDRRHESPTFTGAGADGLDIRYVPTFIVVRDRKEVGRVVESAPNGIEKDLLSLLDGTKTGVITGRKDL